MPLNSQNFAVANAANAALYSYIRQTPVIDLLANSAISQMFTQKFIDANPGGSFAATLKVPRYDINQVANFSASIVNSWDVAYTAPPGTFSVLNDDEVDFNCNRIASDQFKVTDTSQLVNANGKNLTDIGVTLKAQNLVIQMEAIAVAGIVSAGQFASASSGVGVPFVLDTSSVSNLQASFTNLANACDAQEMPYSQRNILLNPQDANKILNISQTQIAQTTNAGNTGNSYVDGTMNRVFGFNVVRSNSMPKGQHSAFDPNKFALVIPIGVQLDLNMTTPTDWSLFHRMKCHWGYQALGKTMTTFDGQVLAGQTEGILRGTVT